MSKKHTHTELEARAEESQSTVMRMTQETFADTGILPSAKELTEYKELDSRFIDFFLETAKREQEARIAQNDRILGLAEMKEKKTPKPTMANLLHIPGPHCLPGAAVPGS